MKKVLVLCTGNSCRSQMAEGYLRHFAEDKAEIYSAGVEKHGVNPTAVQILKEDDIDISLHTSNLMEEYQSLNFDFIITVCDHAQERCPVFPNSAIKLHHNFQDPSKVDGNNEEILNNFRVVRKQIKDFSEKFVQEYLK